MTALLCGAHDSLQADSQKAVDKNSTFSLVLMNFVVIVSLILNIFLFTVPSLVFHITICFALKTDYTTRAGKIPQLQSDLVRKVLHELSRKCFDRVPA